MCHLIEELKEVIGLFIILLVAITISLPGEICAGNVDVILSSNSAFNVMSGPTNLMTVKSNGYVGIGKMNPATDLDVNGNLSVGSNTAQSGTIRIPNQVWISARNGLNSGDAGLIKLDNANDMQIGDAGVSQITVWKNLQLKTGRLAAGSGVPMVFWMDAAGEVMRISTGNNIGIGTSTPNDKLDVVGDIDATGCFQNNDTGTIGGTCVSDGRFKENIVELSGSLDKLAQLRPVYFDWIEGGSNISGEHGSSVGLIAQEVEDIFPHLVVDSADGYKKVRYDLELQMHLISAVNELKRENDELRESRVSFMEQNEHLQRMNESFERRLRYIEERIN